MYLKHSFKLIVIFHRVEQSCGRKALPASLKLPNCDDTGHLPGLSVPSLLSSVLVTSHLFPFSFFAHSAYCLCAVTLIPVLMVTFPLCFHACQCLTPHQKSDSKRIKVYAVRFHGQLSFSYSLAQKSLAFLFKEIFIIEL